GGRARGGARRGLAEGGGAAGPPATDSPAAAEAEARRVRRVVRNARRMPSLWHFAAFQIRHQLADPGRQILFERVSRWPDMRIAVVDFVAVSHCDPSSARS